MELYQKFSCVCVEHLSLNSFGIILNHINNREFGSKKYEIYFLDGIRIITEEKIIPLNQNVLYTLLSTVAKQNTKQSNFFLTLYKNLEQKKENKNVNPVYLFSTKDCLLTSNKFYSFLKLTPFKKEAFIEIEKYISNLPFNFCIDKEAIYDFDTLTKEEKINQIEVFFNNSFNSFYKKPLIIFEQAHNNWDSTLLLNLSIIK